MLAWTGSEQLPWNSYYILIENWWDSVLGWPWALGYSWTVSLKFLFHSHWDGLELASGQSYYILIEYDEILAWAATEHFFRNTYHILTGKEKLIRFWLGLALSIFSLNWNYVLIVSLAEDTVQQPTCATSFGNIWRLFCKLANRSLNVYHVGSPTWC